MHGSSERFQWAPAFKEWLRGTKVSQMGFRSITNDVEMLAATKCVTQKT